MEFKAEDKAGTLRLVSRINASLVDASDNTTGTRNGKLQFRTNYHTVNYPRFEMLGGSNTIVNGSNTIYPSPVLRSTYFPFGTSGGVTANQPLGTFEFFGYWNLDDGAVGAKIVAQTADDWDGAADDYPTELQFYTTNNGLLMDYYNVWLLTKKDLWVLEQPLH